MNLDAALTPRDLEQIRGLGITPDEVLRQLRLFAGPAPRARLDRPCTVGDGITVIRPGLHGDYLAAGESAAQAGRCLTFVPASGAASRMFESLLRFHRPNPPSLGNLERRAGAGDRPAADLLRFCRHVEQFAFTEDLESALERDGSGIRQALQAGDYPQLLRALLDRPGLGYREMPKALIPFHRYREGARTALEEHVVEAVAYGRDAAGECRLHFTIVAEHEYAFRALVERQQARLGKTLEVRLNVTFSHQDSTTDTVAVDPANRPFRLSDGSLLFRPGGHGALLGNLESIGGDLVFVKNVDNTVPDRGKALTAWWKRLLLGFLVRLQQRLFAHLARLESADCSEHDLAEAGEFLRRDLGLRAWRDDTAGELARRRQVLVALLDRPLRVCGVVENRGQPGGGPFWVRDRDGKVTAQIVESAQVEMGNEDQEAIWQAGSHFNPVDLVCALRDRRDRPYDLERFRDPEAVFIASKTSGGAHLKALEHPGLWNGAMAGWNTVFVEVPAETFAPVKSVLDLLRPEHQT